MALVSNNKPRKIILTDNPTLLDSGVQAIPNDFLEWLVQNPSCQYGGYKDIPWDQIITLKEEPKQEFTTVNGNSGCTITVTDEKGNPLTYWGGLEEPKQETHICKYCNAEVTQPDDECYAKPKQETTMKETIEEAARKFDKSKCKHFRREHTKEEVYDSFEEGFIEGAKYQAERMYSEEEVIKIVEKSRETGLIKYKNKLITD
jgi:hypothetical protein